MNEKKILIKAINLKQYFPVGKNSFCKANDGITLSIRLGETLGLVGESGCGKSTFGRTLIQLNKQTSGKVLFYGQELEEVAPKYVQETLRHYRRQLKRFHEFEAKVDAEQLEYDRMDEGTEKLVKLNKLNMLKAALEGKYYDLANVVGGFISVKDCDKEIRLLQEEHSICRRIRSMLESIQIADAKLQDAKYTLNKMHDEGESTAGVQARCDAAQAAVDRLQKHKSKLEKRLQEKKREIAEASKPYLASEKFMEAEHFKDGGIDLSRLKYNEMRLLRSDVQMIFQDPYSSLNPRMTVGNIIGKGMKTHHIFIKENDRMQNEVLRVMDECGLQPYFLHRFPHQFSGGQRQRIGIARSLSVRPKFVICDEAVSALDVSIQSQIINLLQDLKEKSDLTYLFITHDLSVVKYISDRIGVMYLGNLVELAPSQELFDHPMHPYTQALIAAIPTLESRNKEMHIIEGDIPSPVNPPSGCKFHTRCDFCTEICKNVVPSWDEISPGHFAACHNMADIQKKIQMTQK